MLVSVDNSLEEVSGERPWRQDSYLKPQVTDYNMEKVNYPENSLFPVNHGFLTFQKVRICSMVTTTFSVKSLRLQTFQLASKVTSVALKK